MRKAMATAMTAAAAATAKLWPKAVRNPFCRVTDR